MKLQLIINLLVILNSSTGQKLTAKLILQQESLETLKNSILYASNSAERECRQQFKASKWNCSSVWARPIKMRDPMYMIRRLGNYDVVYKTQCCNGRKCSNRETAFVHSINAAAVTYFLTRDCRRGIFRNCACVRQTGQAGEWRGCNDNVKFGEVLSKHFLNARHVDKRKARAVIHLHNNAVGRKAVKKTLKQQCKCHGVSGGCSSKSC
ncbi:protein Wnt-8b-like isoform X1 [Nematostella vectensis]|nr:protein Wnt-8b-like isoform X1 [Nematostella vectensis]XP_048589627.1 protein Wnt-8b-like isoform X1 [Nematostella vectensis]